MSSAEPWVWLLVSLEKTLRSFLTRSGGEDGGGEPSAGLTRRREQTSNAGTQDGGRTCSDPEHTHYPKGNQRQLCRSIVQTQHARVARSQRKTSKSCMQNIFALACSQGHVECFQNITLPQTSRVCIFLKALWLVCAWGFWLVTC